MKACVRGSSTRARSCQDNAEICEFMCATSKTGGRAGADDLTRLAAHILEPVRQVAGEVIRLPRRKHARDPGERQLDATLHHDAALLAPMRKHFVAGLGPRR